MQYSELETKYVFLKNNLPLKYENLKDLNEVSDSNFDVYYLPLKRYLKGCRFENGFVVCWSDRENEYKVIPFHEGLFYRREVKE